MIFADTAACGAYSSSEGGPIHLVHSLASEMHLVTVVFRNSVPRD